jgi:hypothetical protein
MEHQVDPERIRPTKPASARRGVPGALQRHGPAAPLGPATGGFDWVMAALGAALVGGAVIDGWAHRHQPGLETFFTSWHALLYGALLLNGLVLGLRWLAGLRSGFGLREALPVGYGLSFLGVLLFGVGGALDMGWHLLFGVEADFAALMSPTHLLLMLSGALIVTGPLRAAWHRPTGRAGWPAVLSATMLLSVLTFWGQFDHPVIDWWATPNDPGLPAYVGEELGVLGVVLSSALLVGVVLPLVLRFRLPLGSLTVLLGANAVLMSAMEELGPVVAVFLAGGLVGDVLLVALRPRGDRVAALRVFAVALPLATYAAYFAYLLSTDEIVWPQHIWLGSIAAAGLTGLLVSLLVAPPPARTISPEIDSRR